MRATVLIPLAFFVVSALHLPETYSAGNGKSKVESLKTLLAKFESTESLEKKENLLYLIEQNYPEAGGDLLQIAKRTSDINTKYKAIFELGQMKYSEATPFLIESLSASQPQVRANAARALGDTWKDGNEAWRNSYPSLSSELISLLNREMDGGTIEQTSLALSDLKAKEAVSALCDKLQGTSLGPQTKMWLLQAVGKLGSKQNLKFLAGFLFSQKEKSSVSMSAAQAIEELTGQNFGFPKYSGPSSPSIGVEKARIWWLENRQHF